MRFRMVVVALLLASPAAGQASPPPATQNPSPMVETTRPHERLAPRELGGMRTTMVGPGGRPVDLWLSDSARHADRVDLLVHFLGAAWLPEAAAARRGGPVAVATVNLGAGSGVYDRAYTDPAAFDSLMAGIARVAGALRGRPTTIGRVTLTGFSAGHGAIRAILREPRHFARVSAILLLDGMHTSYVPDGTVLANGGTLDERNLAAFAEFARAARRGEKRFVVTHSEIFPGTFASTTETSDWLLRALGLSRTPVLRAGPRGMQQLSDVHEGGFHLLGFAGNTAPDHIDHLHGLPEFLDLLDQ